MLNNMADTLDSLGLQEIGRLARARAREIEEEGKRQQQVLQAAAVVDAIVAKRPMLEHRAGTVDIEHWLKELEGAESLIHDAARRGIFREAEKRHYLEQVHRERAAGNEDLKKLKDLLSHVVDTALGLKTRTDCLDLAEELGRLSGRQFRDADQDWVKHARYWIDRLLSDLDQVSCTGPMSEFVDMIQQLRTRYEEAEEYISAEGVIDTIEEEGRQEYARRADNWMLTNVPPTIDDVNAWDAAKCFSWLQSVAMPPDYLSQEQLDRIEEVRVYARARQVQMTLDTIVEQFRSLDSEERKRCLNRLMSIAEAASA